MVDDGRGLVWTGNPTPTETDVRRGTDAESRLHAMFRAVMWTLHRDRRVTYRELQHVFGLDDAMLEEIRKELNFKQLACDEQGEGLVWTGEEQRTTATPRQPATADTTAVTSPTVSRSKSSCSAIG